MDQVVFIIASVVTNIVSALLGWWLGGKKRSQAECKSSELDNIDKAVEIWRKLADDLNKEVLELKKENAEMRTLLKSLQTEFEKINGENTMLRDDLRKIRTIKNL